MKRLFTYILTIITFFGVISCEKMFLPVNENLIEEDYVSNSPSYAEGLLASAYSYIMGQYTFSCAATDDAVNNKPTNGYRRMATGELTAQYNPAQRWARYSGVFYANRFLNMIDDIEWVNDSTQNVLWKRRLKGEALALRGLYHFYVLQAHAGKDANGQLLGIPYYEKYIAPDGDFNLPRLTFEQSVAKIQTDYEQAYEYLPYVYTNSAASIHPKDTVYDTDDFLAVNSYRYNIRMSAKIVRALQARLHLFAASPLLLNSTEEYKKAAEYATELLADIDYALAPDGLEYYNSNNDVNNPEVLWRAQTFTSYSIEQANFPPSYNGSGEINPTQNIVDAFPMADGYPRGDVNSMYSYDPTTPFDNRDPRLDMYVLRDGGLMGGRMLIMDKVEGNLNAVNAVPQRSTRTGYYLKKLLRPDVLIPVSGQPVGKDHYNAYVRYTELFLILAEAQNEIAGPDYKEGESTHSAKDILGKIRERALGIVSDPYLNGISNPETMRDLIRNERRLELCFEGGRIWDMRRWGITLDEGVTGSDKIGGAYVPIDVEVRAYTGEKYYYMPIPYNETLKFSNLEQNLGW